MQKLLTSFFCILFTGCMLESEGTDNAPNQSIFNNSESFMTLGGIYQIWYQEIEDACDPEEDLIEYTDLLWVLVVDDLENGNHIVHLQTGAGFNWSSVPIAPDGTFQAEFLYYYDLYRDRISGRFSLEETESGGETIGFYAEIHVDIMDMSDREPSCTATYEIFGYKWLQSQEPPEGMDF